MILLLFARCLKYQFISRVSSWVCKPCDHLTTHFCLENCPAKGLMLTSRSLTSSPLDAFPSLALSHEVTAKGHWGTKWASSDILLTSKNYTAAGQLPGPQSTVCSMEIIASFPHSRTSTRLLGFQEYLDLTEDFKIFVIDQVVNSRTPVQCKPPRSKIGSCVQ